MQVHGALVEVHGTGVLIRGPSGIGKSETAVELLRRGHLLVADDLVQLERRGVALVGSAAPLIRHHVELRGIGILYVPELFGPDSVRDEAPLDLICDLHAWRADLEVERVGLERPSVVLEGLQLPCLRLPVRPSGNMATLVEVAARDHQLRERGESAASRLDARIQSEARGRCATPPRSCS